MNVRSKLLLHVQSVNLSDTIVKSKRQTIIVLKNKLILTEENKT